MVYSFNWYTLYYLVSSPFSSLDGSFGKVTNSYYDYSGSFYLAFTRKHLRLSILAFIFHLIWGGLGAFLSATIVG